MFNNIKYNDIYDEKGQKFTIATGGGADCDDCAICKLLNRDDDKKITVAEYNQAMKKVAEEQTGIVGGPLFNDLSKK